MYVKDGATILADSLIILGGILSRPVILFAFRPLNLTQRYRQEMERISIARTGMN